MEILTARLQLREFDAADSRAVHAYQSDPAYLRHYREWEERSEEDVRAFVEMLIGWSRESPRTRFQLAITLQGSREVVGCCGVRKPAAESDEAEFGCELAPRCWGRGYAREASRAILAFGFGELRLRRVWARVVPANARAVRLAEGLGLRLETRTEDELVYAVEASPG